MAQKPVIQYVGQFYVYGSEARQPDLKTTPQKANTNQPKFVRKEKIKVYVDPVALVGLVVAVAMLVLMAFSTVQYTRAVEEYEQMERYVIYLRDENSRLAHNYQSELDLEYVQSTSHALGLIPVSDVRTMTVHVTSPEPEPEPTIWDDIRWFFEGLFA